MYHSEHLCGHLRELHLSARVNCVVGIVGIVGICESTMCSIWAALWWAGAIVCYTEH